MVTAEAPARQTFNSRGVAIRYTVDGHGEPVVLIHGLYSSADINWRLPGTIKCLAQSYQVISLDLRGHGHSGKPQEESAYGIEMARDVVRLLDNLKIKKAHIVGYSLGGMIAMKLATEHPDRFRSLTLGGMGWLREGSALQNFWNRVPERDGPGTPAVCLRSLGKLAVTKEAVQALHFPVAIFVGDHDPVRKLYVEPLQRIRPDWQVTLIDGAGHFDCIAKPQFREEIKKWLDRQPRP
jgi:pimeloyl-ACP methyl ester carboxylesterase